MRAEVAELREAEAEKAAANSVADWVIYQLMPLRQITNTDKARLKDAAERRFGLYLPPELVRKLVEATVIKELTDRLRKAPTPTRRRGFPRPPRR